MKTQEINDKQVLQKWGGVLCVPLVIYGFVEE